MAPISRSAALLTELAAHYGVADQIEDPSTLDAMIFRSYQVEIVYRPHRDVFSLSAPFGGEMDLLRRPKRPAGAGVSAAAAARKLRLYQPDSERRLLWADVPVSDLSFAQFARAVDEFLDAVETARAGRAIPLEDFAPPDFPSPDLIWIKT